MHSAVAKILQTSVATLMVLVVTEHLIRYPQSLTTVVLAKFSRLPFVLLHVQRFAESLQRRVYCLPYKERSGHCSWCQLQRT